LALVKKNLEIIFTRFKKSFKKNMDAVNDVSYKLAETIAALDCLIFGLHKNNKAWSFENLHSLLYLDPYV
jgi:hypothetical protein